MGLALAPSALAIRSTVCELGLPRLAEPQFDSSVELELKLTPETMQFITSTDGTLRPFGPLPARTQKWIEENKPRYADKMRELPWDQLPFEEKQYLMRRPGPAHDFFRDRSIKGTKIRDEIEVVFRKNTTFLGQMYPRGKHTLRTASFMTPHVEYGDPNHMKNAGDIELHFRVRQSAGSASKDAWTLLEGMKIPRNHQHVHIVAKMPLARLMADPTNEGFRSADFIRRANLLAEMISVMEGTKIFQHSDHIGEYFAYLERSDYTGLQSFFTQVGRGQSMDTGSRFKMGWIGMSAGNKYDLPSRAMTV